MTDNPQTLGELWDHIAQSLSTTYDPWANVHDWFGNARDWFWDIRIDALVGLLVFGTLAFCAIGLLYGGIKRFGDYLEERGKRRDM
jgi:hypothetical protein